jgi:hypothetical protein
MTYITSNRLTTHKIKDALKHTHHVLQEAWKSSPKFYPIDKARPRPKNKRKRKKDPKNQKTKTKEKRKKKKEKRKQEKKRMQIKCYLPCKRTIDPSSNIHCNEYNSYHKGIKIQE